MSAGKLQHELGKRLPFDSSEQEATLNIFRTSDQYQIHFSRLFRRYGLTHSQYNILRILRGEARPLPCLEIASRMISVVPGITGLVDRLEQAGWVTRSRSPDDRRVVYVNLTGKAREALDQLDLPVIELHHRLIGHLTSDELEQLIRLLEKARARLHAP